MLDTYDVIVVGAGASGCALAARLSEDPARSVLLVEAGPRFVGVDAYPPELRYGALFGASAPGHPNNWGFAATLRPGVHQPVPRGRVVGGSTVLNGAVFTRGLAEDFDGWAAAGHDAWSYAAVLPFFRKLERDIDLGGDHGKDGPTPVRRTPPAEWSPVSTAFVRACEAEGYPSDPDMNGPGSIGVGALPLNNIDGVRFNAALAYLDPIARRPNLHVLPDTTVHKIALVGARATGVIARKGGETLRINAGEVVLSAGAVQSPHLLMLSGIGPADELRAAGVPVLHDLPHVGKNVTDHCSAQLALEVPGNGRLRVDPTKKALAEVGLHFTAPGSEEHSDMMLMQCVVPLNASVIQTASLTQRLRALILGWRQLSWAKFRDQLTTQWNLTISVILMQGRSRGEVRLASSDPLVPPTVDYNYLEDPEDLRRLRAGVRLAARLVDSAPYKAIGARRTAPGDEALQSDASLDRYLLSRVGTTIHMASTCRMGASREDSVVDQYCRIHGVANLRVVDTSIMPIVVRRCPNATAVMIGERAAAFFQSPGTDGRLRQARLQGRDE